MMHFDYICLYRQRLPKTFYVNSSTVQQHFYYLKVVFCYRCSWVSRTFQVADVRYSYRIVVFKLFHVEVSADLM
jgi:hypothetical protein